MSDLNLRPRAVRTIGAVQLPSNIRSDVPCVDRHTEQVERAARYGDGDSAGEFLVQADRSKPGVRSQAARMRKLCRFIEENSDADLTLAALGRRANMSAFHLQRTFKAAVGMTPRQYVEACRLKALKRGLRTRKTVGAAVYEAGFGSGSRVYERADSRLGMTPRQYGTGGAGTEISFVTAKTPFGLLMMGATDRGLCFVQFGANEAQLTKALREEYSQAAITPADLGSSPEFGRWMSALAAYLDGKTQRVYAPIDVHGTAFQMLVWEYLQRIPRGETRSYKEVAAGIGQPRATRAVANACGANRVALAIPCHRVIRGDGQLGGYRWGMARKKALLELERRVVDC